MFGSKHVALKELRSINYYMCLLPAHLLSLRAMPAGIAMLTFSLSLYLY